MIGKGAQYLTAAGFGRYRITAASLGSLDLLGTFSWLKAATKQAIMDAFGVDGPAVIAATNEYLNGIAASDKAKATALAALINEDPMMVCSLGLEPNLTVLSKMPIRWHRMTNGYWDTGLQVTMTNWNKIRYILDAVATTTNRGNNWWANGIGGGSTCCLHVGMNNGTGNTSVQFTYANGYNDVSTGVYGTYNTHYRWDFDLKRATYKVYNEDGTLACDVAATLRAPTANNTSGGITVGRWHQYNNINSGSTHSADTRECLQYVDDELVNWFVPFTRNGVFGMMNLVTDTFAAVSGTPEEKFGWWENGSFVEWTPPTP